MRTRQRVLLAIFAVATLSCGSPPDLERQLDAARSWAATLRLAGEERRTGATSARYTAQLRDRGREARRELSGSLATAATRAADRAAARAALDSLDAALAALDAVAAR